MPGKVCYDGEKIQIKIRKRAHTPILKGVEKLNAEVDELRDDIFYFIKNLDETADEFQLQ